MRTARRLAGMLLLAAACAPPAEDHAQPPPGRAVPERPYGMGDPAVRAFLARQNPPAHLADQKSLPSHDLVFFTAFFPDPSFYGEGESRDGVRYGRRIGWIPYDSLDARPSRFRIPPDDPFFRSVEFARFLDSARVGWRYPFGPWLASHPETPIGALRIAIASAPDLHRLLLAHPRVREDLPSLQALRHGRVYQEEWREAAMPRLSRIPGDERADSSHLRLLLETLAWGAPRADLAAALARHPVVRRDSALLLRLYDLRDPAYQTTRTPAMDAMLALRPVPGSVWDRLPWWETHPRLIDDARVRGRREALKRMRSAADPFRYADLRVRAARLLLAEPDLDPESLVEIASEAGANARRCQPRPYPVREIGLSALRHPRANRDVAIALVYVRGEEEVRALAYYRLTGQPLPTRSVAMRSGEDPGLLLQAHGMASTRLITAEDWHDTVMAVLDRWDAAGLNRTESREWREVIRAHPDPTELGRTMLQRTPRMEQLRKVSPFLALIPRDELDQMGVGCDLVGR